MEQLEHVAKHPYIPIETTYRVYLSDDPTQVQNNPPLKLYVLSVTASNEAVTFNAGLVNIRKIPFPRVVYNIEQFAGLKR